MAVAVGTHVRHRFIPLVPLGAHLGIALGVLFAASSAVAQPTSAADRQDRQAMLSDCRAASRSMDGHVDQERVRQCVAAREQERLASQRTEEADRRREAIAKDLEAAKSVSESSSLADREQRDRVLCRAQSLNPDATVNADAYIACRGRGKDRERELAARRQRCGRDYMRVDLGMSWARVVDCAGPFNTISQINRRQRVVTTYESMHFRVSVIDGKVAAWQETGRRRLAEAR
jgi:hypothetical protein